MPVPKFKIDGVTYDPSSDQDVDRLIGMVEAVDPSEADALKEKAAMARAAKNRKRSKGAPSLGAPLNIPKIGGTINFGSDSVMKYLGVGLAAVGIIATAYTLSTKKKKKGK